VSRGRELVDGVSGARPGGRGPAGAAAGGFNPAGLGRWVEERLDWLLDDDSDEHWREPWQEAAPRQGARARGQAWDSAEARRPDPDWRSAERRRPQAGPEAAGSEPAAPLSHPVQAPPGQERPRDRGGAPAAPASRRGLEAVSRRQGQPAAPEERAPAAGEQNAWPDEASFSLNRWQRPQPQRGPDPLQRASSQDASRPVAEPDPAPQIGGSQPGARRPLPRSTRRR